MNHYIYRTEDPVTEEFYIGVRSCESDPRKDTCYSGSFKVWEPEDHSRLEKTIINDQFESREDANMIEYMLIKKFIQYEKNQNYHIPSEGFHTTGTVTVYHKDDQDKKCKQVPVEKYHKSNDLIPVCKDRDLSGINNPFYGKSHTDEWKKKKSKEVKKWIKENSNPMEGKNHTEDTKKRISDARKEKYSGKNHPMFGKTHSEETKKKMSKSRKEGLKKGTIKVLNGDDLPQAKKVKHVETGKEFSTLTECAEFFDITIQSVSQHCSGIYKNQKFEFVEE